MNAPSFQRDGKRPLLLVVDDAEDSRTLLAMMLKPRYDVRLAGSGTAALAAAAEEPRPKLILLDLVMPDLDGYEVCRRLKADAATAGIPVVLVTSRIGLKEETEALKLGAADFLRKPISVPIALLRIASHLALQERTLSLQERVSEAAGRVHRADQQLIHRLTRAVEYREGGLTHRVARVGRYVRLLAEGCGMDAATCALLAQAAPVYDVGKLGIPETILNKTGELTESEWKEMRKHPEIGASIIGDHKDPLLALARVMALTHHERWDGRGYPAGLSGDAIPWPGRIMALADSFETMTITQRYREPIPLAESASRIEREAGAQFDPRVVESFRKVLGRMIEVKQSIPDELEGIHELDFTVRGVRA